MNLQKLLSLPKERLAVTPPCIDATGATVYMNRKDVRKALHIPDDLPEWAICRLVMNSMKLVIPSHFIS